MYQGRSVILRPFETTDLERSRQWVNSHNIAALVDRVLPVSGTEQEAWYASMMARPDCVFFAIDTEAATKHIGNVWLWDIHWRHRKAELRILIGDGEFRGSGYGSAAIEMTTAFGFRNLNLKRIYAYVLANNAPAKRAFEKAGFSCEGLLKKDRFIEGVYVDTYIMAILRKED